MCIGMTAVVKSSKITIIDDVMCEDLTKWRSHKVHQRLSFVFIRLTLQLISANFNNNSNTSFNVPLGTTGKLKPMTKMPSSENITSFTHTLHYHTFDTATIRHIYYRVIYITEYRLAVITVEYIHCDSIAHNSPKLMTCFSVASP